MSGLSYDGLVGTMEGETTTNEAIWASYHDNIFFFNKKVSVTSYSVNSGSSKVSDTIYSASKKYYSYKLKQDTVFIQGYNYNKLLIKKGSLVYIGRDKYGIKTDIRFIKSKARKYQFQKKAQRKP
ncbi:MAG: hypothetical protein J7539_17900 [Niabella sp.]|nr:hypothetical protein [Niabella sp.]